MRLKHEKHGMRDISPTVCFFLNNFFYVIDKNYYKTISYTAKRSASN